jgi:hypothetical protein
MKVTMVDPDFGSLAIWFACQVASWDALMQIIEGQNRIPNLDGEVSNCTSRGEREGYQFRRVFLAIGFKSNP